MSKVYPIKLLRVYPTQLILTDGTSESQPGKGPAQGHTER